MKSLKIIQGRKPAGRFHRAPIWVARLIHQDGTKEELASRTPIGLNALLQRRIDQINSGEVA